MFNLYIGQNTKQIINPKNLKSPEGLEMIDLFQFLLKIERKNKYQGTDFICKSNRINNCGYTSDL